MKLQKFKIILSILIVLVIICTPNVIFSNTEYKSNFSILMNDKVFFNYEVMNDYNFETFNVLNLCSEKSNMLKLFNVKKYPVMYLMEDTAIKAGPGDEYPIKKHSNSEVSKAYLIREINDSWGLISLADNMELNVGYVKFSELYNSEEDAKEASKSKEEQASEYMHKMMTIV